jgi:hypothetical protein
VIKQTPAPSVANTKLLLLPYAYAASLMLLVVWQLVMFERFAPYVASYLGDNSQGSAAIIAMVLIGMELFALPFLLRMSLSPLARFMSAGFAFATPLAWAGVTMMSDSFNIMYLLLNVGFFALGSASFWLLGGPRVMHIRRT